MSFIALAQEQKLEEMFNLLTSKERFLYDRDDLLCSIDYLIENNTERFIEEILNKVDIEVWNRFEIGRETLTNFLEHTLTVCFRNSSHHLILNIKLLQSFKYGLESFLCYDSLLQIAYEYDNDEIMEFLLKHNSFSNDIKKEIITDIIDKEKTTKLQMMMNYISNIYKRYFLIIAKTPIKPFCVEIIEQSMEPISNQITEHSQEIVSNKEFKYDIDDFLGKLLNEVDADNRTNFTKEQKQMIVEFIIEMIVELVSKEKQNI